MMLSLPFILQCRDSWQDTTFEEFKRGTATGRDMGHFVCRTRLFNRRRRVAAADDRSGAVLRSFSQYPDNGVGSLCEIRHFRNAERAIPDDGLRLLQCIAESGDGCGANIKNAPCR